jgi:serine/threonine protein kinase
LSSSHDKTVTHAADTPRGKSRSRETIPERIGDFKIVGTLGKGGMGTVYEAESERLGKRVALKVIAERASEHLRKRFKVEARAAARLRHPNIVRTLEYHQTEAGRHYLAMELIQGENLSDRLRRDDRLTIPRALQVGIAVAEGLAYAHENAVVHRDIKPHNILLTPDGKTLLTDFGLAKMLDQEGEALTRTGDLVGTPSYMSPEQARGNRHAIGPATDVYGLGATLYHALTGHVPFGGSAITEVVFQIVSYTPEPPRSLRPEIPQRLEAILLKCLAKEPASRYSQAAKLAADLRGCLNRLETAHTVSEHAPGRLASRAHPAPPAHTGAPDTSRGLKIAGVALLVLLNALFLVDLFRGSSASAPPSPPGGPPAASPAESPGTPLPGQSLAPIKASPAWLAWGVAQRGVHGSTALLAPGWREAKAEAHTRNVPLAVIVTDATMGFFPPQLEEWREKMGRDFVAVAASSGSHAPAGKPCTVFDSIQCSTHRDILKTLRAEKQLTLPAEGGPQPPRLYVCRPGGDPSVDLQLLPRMNAGVRLQDATAILAKELGPPHLTAEELFGLGGSLAGELDVPDFPTLEVALTRARVARDLAEPVGAIGRERELDLCRAGLGLARGTQDEARREAIATLERLFGKHPATREILRRGLESLP